MKGTAGFFRGKATECRNLAAGADDRAAIARGLEAMALELDACAVALEAGHATAREIEPESFEETTGTAARGGRLVEKPVPPLTLNAFTGPERVQMRVKFALCLPR